MSEVLMYVVGLVVVVLLVVGVSLRVLERQQTRLFAPGERVYTTGTGETVPFEEFVVDKPAVSLSVVVPAYNEEARIRVMLDEALEWLNRDYAKSYEIIVVDDGSADKTSDIARAYRNEHIRVLTLQQNRGKGGAVRRGVLCARGELILMADADGASRFSDLQLLLDAMRDCNAECSDPLRGLVCGSRAHLQDEAMAQRSVLRNITTMGFHMFVVVLGGITTIHDTQCGFKLFGRRTAHRLFTNLHVERWAFDLELLYLALRVFSTPVREVAIHWQEIDGSKLSVVTASFQMARDLARIRFNYLFGVWEAKKD